MEYSRGNANPAEAARSKLIAIVDQPANGLANRGQLGSKAARLTGKKSPGQVGGGICEQSAIALGKDIHVGIGTGVKAAINGREACGTDNPGP